MDGERTVTLQLATYASEISFGELPEEVVSAAKRAILDSLGCLLGGSRTDPGRMIMSLFSELGGKPQGLVPATGQMLPLVHSTYVNAALANLLDIDDTFLGQGHLGATIVPPAMAATAYRSISGQELIAAVTAGYEVSARIGAAIQPSPDRRRQVYGLGTFEVFGTAATLGRLLCLGPLAMASAFGIAGASAPVPSVYKEGIEEGRVSWVKNNFGWAAAGGTLAVLLAECGFRGHVAFLDGERGFWRMAGSDRCDFGAMGDALGQEYRILQNGFKPYACCRFHHSTLDAVRTILQGESLTAEQVDEIRVRSIWRLADHMHRRPTGLIDAQFSLPYQVAGHVAGKAKRFDWTLDASVRDPDLVRIAEKVMYTRDDQYDRMFFNEHICCSTVEIQGGGISRDATIKYAWGEPQNPMTDAELEAKFVHLAGPALGGDERARALIGLVGRLEQVDDVCQAIRSIIL